MQDASSHNTLLETLQNALERIPPSSDNRGSVLQTLLYTERSFTTPNAEERRSLLRHAAAHLKNADRGDDSSEHSAIGKARRAMTAALFEQAS